MARTYLFVDEAGNFDFSPEGSRYFILASLAITDCRIGDALLELRRNLVWDGHDLNGAFHATEDRQVVRDAVFAVLTSHEFRVDATILEKAKTVPNRQNEDDFYRLAWYVHMKHVAPMIVAQGDELLVVGASIGTRKKRALLSHAIAGVMGRTARVATVRSTHWPAETDPCLQAIDYCCWAIQRKWERGDDRSYALIQDRLASEFDYFRRGTTWYY